MFTLKDSKQTSSFAKRKLVLVDFRGPELNVVRAFLSEAYPIVDVASEDERFVSRINTTIAFRPFYLI